MDVTCNNCGDAAHTRTIKVPLSTEPAHVVAGLEVARDSDTAGAHRDPISMRGKELQEGGGTTLAAAGCWQHDATFVHAPGPRAREGIVWTGLDVGARLPYSVLCLTGPVAERDAGPAVGSWTLMRLARCAGLPIARPDEQVGNECFGPTHAGSCLFVCATAT